MSKFRPKEYKEERMGNKSDEEVVLYTVGDIVPDRNDPVTMSTNLSPFSFPSSNLRILQHTL
jgi:hypothetical protein